jgi:bifunctional enzyme CysN/CysC
MAIVPGAAPDDARERTEVADRRPLLRLIACGGVDDGKSTLLGRLLHDSGNVFDDRRAALEVDARKFGPRGADIDYALLLDGLSAEREQGMTIDVAHRCFSTARRRFVVADVPGHEHHTRDMVTGASVADLAIVLVDARKGLLTQTRLHSQIVSRLGVRHIVLAVNKMDLVGYSADVFAGIEAAYREFCGRIGLREITCIPTCAVHGDNIIEPRGRTPWYSGPMLLEHLETVIVEDERDTRPLRMPIQRVIRSDDDFRGYAGTIVSGVVRPGDRVRVEPAGRQSRVARIVAAQGDLPLAVAHQAITLTLEDCLDIGRGDVVSAAGDPVAVADQFEATLIWMEMTPMLRGRSYLMKTGATTVNATVAPLKYKVNVDTLEHVAADTLELSEIGICDLELDRAIAFEPYASNRDMGGFILIDRTTNSTVGAGMLHFALRRSRNITRQPFDIDKSIRAAFNEQQPCVLWFTGLSGAGKSTLANLVEKKLHAMGRHTYVLDGDNIRKGLSKDLGFTDADRVENIRRVAEVAALMADAGLIVLVAFISPFRNERRMARALLPQGQFLEVFIDTPVAAAEARDPKGLYRKARAGDIKNFTGIDSPYEVPENPEIRIDTLALSPEAAAEHIVERMQRLGL